MLALQQYYQGTNLRGRQKRDTYDEALIESQATKLFKVPSKEASVLNSPYASLLCMAPTEPEAFDPESVRRATTAVAEEQEQDMQDAHVEMAADVGEAAAETQQSHEARMQQMADELRRAAGEEVQRAREQAEEQAGSHIAGLMRQMDCYKQGVEARMREQEMALRGGSRTSRIRGASWRR